MPYLEHALVKVFLFFFVISEPFEDQLTKVREIYQTFPINGRSISHDRQVYDCSHTLQYYSVCPQLPAPMDSNPTFSWPDADPTQDKIQYLLRQKSSM